MDGRIERISDREIAGYSKFAGRGGSSYQDYTLYFVIQTSKPFTSMGGWSAGKVQRDVSRLEGKGDMGAFLNFATTKGDAISARSAISFVSVAGARLNLTR